MIVLGIETSCDETACAVVRDHREVCANVVRSQVALHAPYGGVVPEIAGRAHVEDIAAVVAMALREAGLTRRDLDLIAVTTRPGLIGALVIGVTAAKALAFAWDLPLVAVDHLHAHVAAAWIGGDEVACPAVGLVVSGGHTTLLDVRALLDVRILGETTDDAVGEAFDKVAKILDLGYPGGPAVSALARQAQNPVELPRALLGPDSLDFSFSGIKTAVLYMVRGQQGRVRTPRLPAADVAAGFQAAVVDVLVEKCRRALSVLGYRALIVGGGVAANGVLREALAGMTAGRGARLHLASREFCTDNAAMVAALGGRLYAAAPAGAAEGLHLDAHPGTGLPRST